MSEDSEEMLAEGTVTRHNRYYTIMKARVEGKTSHPVNNGIAMQAHHLISCEGAKRSGKGNFMKSAGYDINDWPNMVFLPSTLRGACHLGVQLHLGNHTAPPEPTIQNDGDDDKHHPKDYHKMVAHSLRAIDKGLKVVCENKQEQIGVIKRLNKISLKILDNIQYTPSQAPLTHYYRQFVDGHAVGCSNANSVPEMKKSELSPCQAGRNHQYQQNSGKKKTIIMYPDAKPFRLKVGN